MTVSSAAELAHGKLIQDSGAFAESVTRDASEITRHDWREKLAALKDQLEEVERLSTGELLSQ